MNETASVEQTIVEFPVPKPANEKKFSKSKYANLYRHTKTGEYFVSAKVCGRKIRKRLLTSSVEIAKARMDKLLAEERERSADVPEVELTFAHLASEFIRRLEDNPALKESTRKYRMETLKVVRKTWPNIDAMAPQDFTEQVMVDWANGLRRKYSPTRYNGTIQTMRGILQVAVDRGVLRENPARARTKGSVRGIQMANVPLAPPSLPEPEEFVRLLKHLDSRPERAHAANLIRFLAYSGCRIGAARLIRPDNIDLPRNEVVIPAIKYDTHPSRIPMIPEMKWLCKKLLFQYPGDGPLFAISNPRKALRNACVEAGIKPLTNHDLRHMFATRCLECGVDIKTVASWLGHRDGGKLLLSRYSHLRNEHSQQMATKVSFSVAGQSNPAQDQPTPP